MEKKEVFNLKLVTPEKTEILADDVVFVKVRTTSGDLGILANHSNYMSPLGEGMMKIKTEKEEYNYFLSGGFLEVNNNKVTVLAEDAIEASNEKEVRKIRQEILDKAIEMKKREDQDILGTKKRIQDSLRK